MTKPFAPLLALLLSLLLLTTGCGDDDGPVIENEEELITDVIYTLVPDGGSSGGTVVLTFSDRDGDGPVAPDTTISGSLLPNTTYAGTIAVVNASNPSDVEDITAEVREEDDEHQFFYQTSGGLNALFSYADQDDNGDPVGLLTTMRTGASSAGTLTITLRHEPNKGADGVSINNPSAAGGETDVEVSFAVAF